MINLTQLALLMSKTLNDGVYDRWETYRVRHKRLL